MRESSAIEGSGAEALDRVREGEKMARRRYPWVILLLLATLAACGDRSVSSTGHVLVYWDQNEEEDALVAPGEIRQLIAPWDPNGQMCILPDGSGRFVTGYNPTLPSQHNPGSLKPVKNPPTGMALWDQNGDFTGTTIVVPGPYALPGSDVGGDIPPDPDGTFNANGAFTGCAFDSKGDLFAADIGQAQGSAAAPDQGRIIEWFPPDYRSYCIVVGPTAGGVGPHHVNGSGGLRNPGTMAVDSSDALYVPESGAARVLRFDPSVLPTRAADCGPDGLLVPPARFDVFISGSGGIPGGIARDPSCDCWAVSHLLGSPAVAFYDDAGRPTAAKMPVPAGPYSPFGLAVAPGGDLFFVDIGLTCTSSGCDTVARGGGVFEVRFSDGIPAPPERVAGGLDFPVSVTVCDPSRQTCPRPARDAALVPVEGSPSPGGGG